MSKIKAWFYRSNKERCALCGNRLKEHEKQYYGVNCEKCESRFMGKMLKQG